MTQQLQQILTQRIEILKQKNINLINLVPKVELKVGQKLKMLSDKFETDCEEYKQGKRYGVSNFYFEWYKERGSTIVKTMYGVVLRNGVSVYEYTECHLYEQDKNKTFETVEEFVSFLKSIGKIE